MRTVALMTMILMALAIGGCGKKEEKKAAEPAKKEAPKPADEKAEEAPAAEEKAAEEPKAEAAAVTNEEAPAAEEKAAEEAPAAEEKPAEEAPAATEEKAAEEAPKAEAEAAPKEEPKAEAAAVTKEKTAEDLQARRTRIQEIYKLGRSGNPEDLQKLEAIITGEGEAFEKATAIRALGHDKREGLVEALKGLAGGDDLAVKSEAAILLYQLGEKEFAKPLMEEMLDQGVALRRAFFKGLEDGKYVYDEEALGFFEKAMEAKQVHVRLDAALGLLHMDKKDTALAAFKEALADQEKEYVRLTAVSYLASARDIPEAKALLEQAANDPSPRVANRAKQILGTNIPAAK
jgi:hypothetical protein